MSTSRLALRWALCLQGLLVVGLLVGLRLTGVSLLWSGAIGPLLVVAGLELVWIYFAVTNSAAYEQAIGDGACAIGLLVALALWIGPLQYVVTAWHRPFIDGWLLAVDRSLGVSVQTTAAWLTAHHTLHWWLAVAYFSLFWQMIAIVPVLVLLKQRETLWEYIAVFHLVSVATVLMAGLWPAEGPFTALGFTAGLSQTDYISALHATRAGVIGPLEYGHLVGMVMFPSFHFAGAWMVTWALRRTWLVWPIGVLNLALGCATFLSGAHYLADGLGSVLLLVGGYALWRAVRPRYEATIVLDFAHATTRSATLREYHADLGKCGDR